MTHLIPAAVLLLAVLSIALRWRHERRRREQQRQAALAYSMAQELARLKRAGLVVDIEEKRRAS